MMRALLKWWLGVVLAAMIGAGAYGTYLYWQVRSLALSDDAQKADAIVVLGAAQYNGRPSPVFKARLDHAWNLFRKGFAGVIITTGGFGPDPDYSEAHVGSQYLIRKGMDPSRIIIEQGSGSSYDSVRAAARLMRAKGWKTIVVVSDGFHMFRLKRMLEDSQITTYTSPAPDSPIELQASHRV